MNMRGRPYQKGLGMIKIGIAGCGKIAQVRHLPEIAANEKALLAGVYDRNGRRAAEMAAQYDTKQYATYEEMLEDPAVDAVCVCVANKNHAEFTVKALEHGKHVLCEKPMAVTREECRSMLTAQEKSRKTLMIAQNQRFAKAHVLAKELLLRGEIGKLLTFKTSFAHSGPENWSVVKGGQTWFFDDAEAGFGVMADLGIHKIDVIRFITGCDIAESRLWRGTLHKTDAEGEKISLDDNMICLCTLKNGAAGTVTVSWTCYGAEDNSTVLYGTEGVIKIYMDDAYPLIVEKKDGTRVLYETEGIQTNVNQTRSGVMDEFVESLSAERKPEADGQDVMKSMNVIFDAVE
ncbi:Gfo/Idh/MocA family oxidoreductase [Clostridium sp. AN503]|uniref:Gfo/Idh/MocA family protein n=1 Tax=Clostridium sp. AN503 TaxID=3160598 RepID=UPI00345950BB